MKLQRQNTKFLRSAIFKHQIVILRNQNFNFSLQQKNIFIKSELDFNYLVIN